MKLYIYKVKLNKPNINNVTGYIEDDGQICYYPRHEAMNKANLWDGKIEVILHQIITPQELKILIVDGLTMNLRKQIQSDCASHRLYPEYLIYSTDALFDLLNKKRYTKELIDEVNILLAIVHGYTHFQLIF